MEVAFQSRTRRSRLGIFAVFLVSSLLHISEAKFFSSEPSNPTMAVLGVNSSRVVLHWNYSLPTGSKLVYSQIKRYKNNPDEAELVVFGATIQQSYNDGRLELLKPVTFVINNVTEADEYVYRCIVFVKKGGDYKEVKSSVQLKVYALPKISDIASNQTATQGQDVDLVCLAQGRPTPTVTWTRVSDGAQVNSSFHIRGKQDNGKYKCTASNGVGFPAVAFTVLDVQYLEKPNILPKIPPQSNGTLRVRTNGTLIVRCSTEAEPEANFEWLLKSTELLSKKAVYMKENVGLDDEGTYECVATNTVGLTEWSRVKVEVVPLTDGPKYAYNMTFRIIHMCWNDGYEDNRTEDYKELSTAVRFELMLVYGGEISFIGIKVLNFSCLVSKHGDRAGSVLVDFQAIFDNEIGEKYALNVLRDATKNGVLGNFKVEAESPGLLRTTTTRESPTLGTTKSTTEAKATPTDVSPSTANVEVFADSGGASVRRIPIVLVLGSFFVGMHLV